MDLSEGDKTDPILTVGHLKKILDRFSDDSVVSPEFILGGTSEIWVDDQPIWDAGFGEILPEAVTISEIIPLLAIEQKVVDGTA